MGYQEVNKLQGFNSKSIYNDNYSRSIVLRINKMVIESRELKLKMSIYIKSSKKFNVNGFINKERKDKINYYENKINSKHKAIKELRRNL